MSPVFWPVLGGPEVQPPHNPTRSFVWHSFVPHNCLPVVETWFWSTTLLYKWKDLGLERETNQSKSHKWQAAKTRPRHSIPFLVSSVFNWQTLKSTIKTNKLTLRMWVFKIHEHGQKNGGNLSLQLPEHYLHFKCVNENFLQRMKHAFCEDPQLMCVQQHVSYLLCYIHFFCNFWAFYFAPTNQN